MIGCVETGTQETFSKLSVSQAKPSRGNLAETGWASLSKLVSAEHRRHEHTSLICIVPITNFAPPLIHRLSIVVVLRIPVAEFIKIYK